MKEATLRAYHRNFGVVLLAFLAVQAVTGMILSFEPLEAAGHAHAAVDGQYEGWIEALHHGGGVGGAVYRLALGAAVLGQGLGGLWIYLRRKRRRR